MIIMLKNTSGDYRPLDVFEDFKITYNHQYEDYKSVGGKLMPYTNTFKVPTTTNNRELCGMPFDLAPPTQTSIDGKMLYTDGTLAFEFVADVEGQTTNVLQPYISLTIIDKISKAIADLSKWKMSDLLKDNTFNFATDDWVFGNQSDLTDIHKCYLFVYQNYNNKNALFSHDPMRGLSQLHPTFVLNKLVDKMFDYVGLTVESDFLNLDGQLDPSINANQLALTIPAKLKTLSNHPISVDHQFGYTYEGPYSTNTSWGQTERIVGVPSQMPTTSRITVDNFLPATHEPLKMNFDYWAEILWKGVDWFGSGDPYKPKFCSMVDGNLKIKVEGYDNAIKPIAGLGRLFNAETGVGGYQNWTSVTSVTTATPPDMDIRMVNADSMTQNGGITLLGSNFYEQADSYDINIAPVVGKAVYIGIHPTEGTIQYELQLSSSVDVDIDVKANKELNLAYVLCPPDGDDTYEIDYVMTDNYSGGSYDMKMIVRNGYIEYKMINNNGSNANDYYDYQTTMFTRPTGINEKVAKLTFSFDEYTDLPCGYESGNGLPTWRRPNVSVNMGESIKAVVDYSLMDVLKMIMERFNLQMYTTSDGAIHIDTEENRKSGEYLNIDHLVDEAMEAEFVINTNGVLSVKDNNPSFYAEDYNRLDKHTISDDKRDTVTLSFSTSIINKKMFQDTYDGSGYELLKYGYDSNYWGVADRKQLEPKSLKPMFSILTEREVPVYIPTSDINYSIDLPCVIDEDSPDYDEECEDFFTLGFYNNFWHNTASGNIFTSLESTPMNDDFTFISFEDDKFVSGDDNLFKQTWYQNIMSRMNDDSIAVEFEIYASEDTLKILKDFPTIKYKGQDWDLKGFNEYPISNQNGGITKITMIKSEVWS